MNDDTIASLSKLVLEFREERDWRQFHNPKDMALSLVLEAAELMELMQWRSGAELDEHLQKNRHRVEEELADVLGWILLLASDKSIDLADAFRDRRDDQWRKDSSGDQGEGEPDRRGRHTGELGQQRGGRPLE